jgi:hypothetical protein
MKAVLKEALKILSKYLDSIWTLFMTTWFFIKVEELSKLNQLLVTGYLLFLYFTKITKRYENKLIKIKVLRKIIYRNRSIKSIAISEDSNYFENQVDNTLNAFEKITKKGWREDMKNLFKLIWSNKFTAGGTMGVLATLYMLTEELLRTNNYQFNKTVIITLVVYAIVGLWTLFGVNGVGWETIDKVFARVNTKQFNKALNGLVALDVALDTDIIKDNLPKGYKLLEAIKSFIKEADHRAFKSTLDNIQSKVDEHEALVELERRKRTDALIAKLSNQPQVALAAAVNEPVATETESPRIRTFK